MREHSIGTLWLAAAVALSASAVGVGGLGGCGSAKAAAAKDPMKCERDPSCGANRGRYPDCTRQCNDDEQCVARCEEVQQGVDHLGHP
jgi:hypothetical protein